MSSNETRVSKCRVSKLEYRNVKYQNSNIKKSSIKKSSIEMLSIETRVSKCRVSKLEYQKVEYQPLYIYIVILNITGGHFFVTYRVFQKKTEFCGLLILPVVCHLQKGEFDTFNIVRWARKIFIYPTWVKENCKKFSDQNTVWNMVKIHFEKYQNSKNPKFRDL